MNTEKALETAREIYSRYGVDVDAAIESVKNTPVSIQCWQGDDVGGFEAQDGDLTGGYPVPRETTPERHAILTS